MKRMDVTNFNGGTRVSEGCPRFRNGDVKRATAVRVRVEDIVLPTYMPAPPDKNPMFLENRVYQGSSGKVYPLPFTDRVAEKPVERKWKAVWIENEFIRAMVLPEIGGQIADPSSPTRSRTNGRKDCIRRNRNTARPFPGALRLLLGRKP